MQRRNNCIEKLFYVYKSLQNVSSALIGSRLCDCSAAVCQEWTALISFIVVVIGFVDS